MQAAYNNNNPPFTSSSYSLDALSRPASSGASLTCSSHGRPSQQSSGTCSNSSTSTSDQAHHNGIQLTPPEHTYSCPSFAASSTAFGSSPSLHSDFLFPPPGPSNSSTASLPYHFQHHLPKSLSRSSISSDGSTLLFSPSQDLQHFHSYSPLTPPLPPPSDISFPQQQTIKRTYSAAPAIESLPSSQSNRLPILPNMEAKTTGNAGTAGATSASTSTTVPVITPGCISQLATYLAEMVVYLWFSPPQKRAPTFPKPTSAFARFCNDILTTTQVSQSVVVLALYFISKLQTKHSIEPRAGSEYKLTIASLMLANKILDDHTYTNKTWSEVSGLPLDVLNGAEVEFLQGLDFDLHVSHTAYKAWYTMLQNGESSNIIKQSAPSRKKAKLINPIAPSAPTSPLHHTASSASAASNAGLGFDFTFAAPQLNLQAPASRQPSSAWLPNPNALDSYMYPTLSSNAVVNAQVTPNTTMSSSGSRKRRMSDAALSPPRTAMAASSTSTTNQGEPPLRISTSFQPVPLHALPPHMYTPIVSTPNSARHMVTSRATTPHGQQNFMQQQQQQQSYFVHDFMSADFNALTSSWSPVEEMGRGARPPQDLTYYALAAGQQRGGYLTHQSLQPLPAGQAYYHPGMAMHPVTGRALAPLPRAGPSSASGSIKNNTTPVLRQIAMPPRMSLSLSPTDTRVMYSQYEDCQYPQSGQYGTSHMPSAAQQPMYMMPMQCQARYTPPIMSQGYAFPEQRPANAYPQQAMQARSQAPLPSPLEPSLQNLALSSASSSSTTTPSGSRQQAQQQQVMQGVPPMSYQSYYSSFANNGLPGVLSWPVQALAKYHNVVQPHQQAWPRDFS